MSGSKTTEETLDAFLESVDKPFTPGRYHASSVLDCPAKHFYARQGEPRDFPKGIGERGRRVEDYVLEAYVKSFGEDEIYTQVKTEREIIPGIVVSGKVDVMRVGYNLQPRKILEVKSMEGSPFNLKESYEFQALFYDWVYQPTEGTEVVVINCGDFTDRKIYPVKWTEDKWVRFIEYWMKVHSQFEEGGKPIPEPQTSWTECWWPKKNKTGRIERVVTCPFYGKCALNGGPANIVPEGMRGFLPKELRDVHKEV